MRRTPLIVAAFAAGCATPAPPPVAAPAPPVDDAPAPAPRLPAAAAPAINRPPIIRQLRMSPEKPNFGDSIRVVVVAEDPEGYGMTYHYDWTINDRADLGEHSDVFRPDELHKGDKVGVTVFVHDDIQDSPTESISVTVVGNPPVMDTRPGQINNFDNVKMRAHDPDGGTITWSLTGGPQGMSIDPDGLLHYKGSTAEPGGSYAVTIVATDPDGDFAKMDLPITLSPGSDAVKAAAAAKAGATAKPADASKEKDK